MVLPWHHTCTRPTTCRTPAKPHPPALRSACKTMHPTPGPLYRPFPPVQAPPSRPLPHLQPRHLVPRDVRRVAEHSPQATPQVRDGLEPAAHNHVHVPAQATAATAFAATAAAAGLLLHVHVVSVKAGVGGSHRAEVHRPHLGSAALVGYGRQRGRRWVGLRKKRKADGRPRLGHVARGT